MKRYFTPFLFLLLTFSLLGQETKQKNWSLSGYAKSLQTLFFIDGDFQGIPTDTLFQENLIHNRLNFKWYPSNSLSFKAELRNRLFWSDLVRLQDFLNSQLPFIDAYSTILDADNDYLDLSIEGSTTKGIAYQFMLDRLYFEYSKDKLEIRLGRQRVNWGINTVWNPNDIFNAFSFVDFDYEERPGSDALRIKYYTGFASSIEIAAKAFDNIDEAVIAGLWKFNKWKYDFQILGGLMQRDLVFGGGWAGNLKNAGFKGEFSYFHSLENDIDNSFTATFGVDYVFSNSMYLNGGFLFNSNGTTSDGSNVLTFELTSKNLYPYKYATFLMATYPINPLLNGSLAIIYSPSEIHSLFINPTITHSIADNWDLDLVGQLIFNKEEKYTSPVQAAFLRIKYSF